MLQETAEGHELVGDALHVVQPVNAKDHLSPFVLLMKMFDLALHFRLFHGPKELVRRNADRNGRAFHNASANGRGINRMRGNLQGRQLHAGAQKMP